jgi:hypothetical protein
MDLFLAIHSAADQDLKSAAQQNHTEMVRRISFGVEKGTMALESWVLSSGGSPIQTGGVDFKAKVPAEHLEDLLGELRSYQDLTEASVACGIGADDHEAERALEIARKRGGSPSVVLYTPEAEQELEEKDKSGELFPSEEKALEKAVGDARPGEATKIDRGTVHPSAAEPSAPSAESAPSAPSADPQTSQPQGAGGSRQLLQAVGQVLSDVKKQLPGLEQLKQSNPPAYSAIMEMAQAVVALAQKISGGQGFQKSEAGKIFRPQAPTKPTKHHHLNLPVGSDSDGKVKVIHADGKVGWVSVRAGQIMSQDGHAVSSREPGAK